MSGLPGWSRSPSEVAPPGCNRSRSLECPAHRGGSANTEAGLSPRPHYIPAGHVSQERARSHSTQPGQTPRLLGAGWALGTGSPQNKGANLVPSLPLGRGGGAAAAGFDHTTQHGGAASAGSTRSQRHGRGGGAAAAGFDNTTQHGGAASAGSTSSQRRGIGGGAAAAGFDHTTQHGGAAAAGDRTRPLSQAPWEGQEQTPNLHNFIEQLDGIKHEFATNLAACLKEFPNLPLDANMFDAEIKIIKDSINGTYRADYYPTIHSLSNLVTTEKEDVLTKEQKDLRLDFNYKIIIGDQRIDIEHKYKIKQIIDLIRKPSIFKSCTQPKLEHIIKMIQYYANHPEDDQILPVKGIFEILGFNQAPRDPHTTDVLAPVT